ncbi:MAG: dTDP-3-amino-3,4,6-trideoxy-alpha-D-glucose transaminase [Anaerolineae bacterium]|nr:dTDP-3-amino-3,4,6-trideoxy-alpha-D-glucose transaminase [Anaerolineae bacterium]
MSKIPLVDLHAQYETLKPEIDAAIQRVIDKTAFILGPEAKQFEENFARFCNVKHAIGLDSGTAALHLAMMALDIGAGDEVITTAHTFIATSEPIALLGARPVLVDIDPRTYNLDPQKLEAAITPRTKAIIPVHLYGQPAEMDAIMDIARKHNIPVIEDAAQAHGATYRNHSVGTFGLLTCFSFYPGKNLGAYGDAGALVTNDDELNHKIRMLRDHGRTSKYEHEISGYGFRLDGIQAAVLDVKLKHLPAWNAARRAHADYYTELLSNVDASIVTPYEPAHVKAVYHLYVIRTRQRDELLQYLKERDIEAGIHYPVPLHMQPVYKNLGYQQGAFPATEQAAQEILSLPIYPELTHAQMERVVETMREFYRNNHVAGSM